MAWSDEPTEQQLGTIYSWIRWCMSNEQAQKAVAYLQNYATRREVSAEMTRLKALRLQHRLDADTCFSSEIWEGFEHE